MLRLCNGSYCYISTARILINNVNICNYLLSAGIIDMDIIYKSPMPISPVGYIRNSVDKSNIIYSRRHRGGKVANKMRVLEKRKRREQEKLAKISQNTPEFIKLSGDVNK